MRGAFLRAVLALWAGLLALAAVPAAAAGAFPAGSTCHIGTDLQTGYEELARTSDGWTCKDAGYSIASPRTILRFDLTGRDGAVPPALVTRMTRFDRLELNAIGRDGSWASAVFGENDMDRSTSDWLMSAPLPETGAGTEAIVVTIDGARHVGVISDAQLATPEWHDGATIRLELLLAGLCGMLCLPLVFNIGFYRVLRERFVLWHAIAVVFMLAHTFVTSGLVNRFTTLSMADLSLISAMSWCGGIAAAALFMADLIEPDKLDPVHRRWLAGLSIWLPAWSLFYLYAGGALRPLAAPLYYASYLPVMGLFIWTLLVAKSRGSRAVNFQIAAWTPLMLCGSVRMLTGLGLTETPLEMQFEQHAAIALEVIITTLGVADRFMILRRQRDRAIEKSRTLEHIAERDPLTGLFNRHGIEDRFAELHALGFNTMAVIDLDHFKAINDNHGHAVGDEVLRIAAAALMPDDDTLAVRMGGEEFLLLLRGRDALNRAEHRRQAITLRVTRELAGLQHTVTASMGLVEQPARTRMKSDFTALYAHCDRLLYEAKRTGRNRTMSEKVRSFTGHSSASEAAA